MTSNDLRKAIELFKTTTSFDVATYLNEVRLFCDLQYGTLVNYYKGNVTSVPFDLVDKLNKINESRTTIVALTTNQFNFNSLLMWDFFELLQQADDAIIHINKLSKWLRSTVSNIVVTGEDKSFVHILKYSHSLEDVSNLVEGKANFENDWTKIAIRNDLREEDYGIEGGIELKVDASDIQAATFNITSVVASINNSSDLYGKDIQSKFEYLDDDVLVLSSKSTILQAISILSQLIKGDNPQFPQNGIQKALIGGTHLDFSYPVVINQLRQVFENDDTMKNFTVLDLHSEKIDQIEFKFSVESRIGELIEGKATL